MLKPAAAAAAAAAAKSLQSCLTLCDPINGSPQGSPIPGILQARTLEWGHFLLHCMKVKSESEVDQSCLTLSHPMQPTRLLRPCDFPGKSTGVGWHFLLQVNLPNAGIELVFLMLGSLPTCTTWEAPDPQVIPNLTQPHL